MQSAPITLTEGGRHPLLHAEDLAQTGPAMVQAMSSQTCADHLDYLIPHGYATHDSGTAWFAIPLL